MFFIIERERRGSRKKKTRERPTETERVPKGEGDEGNRQSAEEREGWRETTEGQNQGTDSQRQVGEEEWEKDKIKIQIARHRYVYM